MHRSANSGASKRPGEASASPSKRFKLESPDELKAKNFNIACEQVSAQEYFDYRTRFQLVYLPSCVTSCDHKGNGQIEQMPNYAEESFMTEIRNQVWYDALEVCHMSITPKRYLSAAVLQEIVEIMLNVHNDQFSEYTAQYIIDSCQTILQQNFSTHPPCLDKNLRQCYVKFLTSSMPSKKDTFTNRYNYEHDRGIIKYCLNRLECELSYDSKEEPLVVPYVPEDLKDTIKGFTWQKQRFEIFESLDRSERIKRLFSVLESILELLQFDSAITLSRYANDRSRHMRYDKLMERVLSLTNSSTMSGTCLQIMRIFANIVHLQYPETMVKIMTSWLNLTVQTLYTRGEYSNSDYPDIKKEMVTCGEDLYSIIAEMPPDSINRILESIEPSYMRHIVGLFYIRKRLQITIRDSGIFNILKEFISDDWKSYPNTNIGINLSDKLYYRPKKVKDKLKYLLDKCTTKREDTCIIISSMKTNGPDLPKKTKYTFPRKDQIKMSNNISPNLNHVVHTLYITLHAALDEIKLQSVVNLSKALNKTLVPEKTLSKYNCSSYTISAAGKMRYETRLKYMKELAHTYNKLKNKKQLPEILNIFGNIELLKVNIYNDW